MDDRLYPAWLRIFGADQIVALDAGAIGTATFTEDDSGCWTMRTSDNVGNLAANPIAIDGVSVFRAPIYAGSELLIDGVIYLVENEFTRSFSRYVTRLLAFPADASEVDRMTRRFRTAYRTSEPIHLIGEGHAVARELHRRLLGDASKFVLIDPSRPSQPGRTQVLCEAFEEASVDTICILQRRLPTDVDELSTLCDQTDRKQRLTILCSDRAPSWSSRIVVPPIQDQERVVDDILDEERAHVSTEDRAWLTNHANSHCEIETSSRRLLTIRNSKSLTDAARSLGLSHTGLIAWMASRQLR